MPTSRSSIISPVPAVFNGLESRDVPTFPERYEQRLQSDSRWALAEASRHFEEKSAVHHALQKITARLNDLHIPYAVVGGMALFQHGYRRFTEDVDLLVSRNGLKLIHERLDGLGYVPPFTHSKNLRDVELGVRIEFLITGDFPGDGRAKPVAFPEPSSANVEVDGICYLKLNALIELKLASGMTSVGRMRDLSDVVELIKVLNLSADYANGLNPFVQEKFRELWTAARQRFMRLWPHTPATIGAQSLDQMIDALGPRAGELKAMREDGVFLKPAAGTGGDYAHLITFDPKIAQKYAMEDESAFWSDEASPDQS